MKPVLQKQAANEKTLAVLRKIDPDIDEIIDTAGHVALYTFDKQTNAWSRKDVEGAMHVVKRRGQPRFRYIVLNRKGSKDFVEDIGSGFTCELQPPYLLYRTSLNNASAEVTGIWFFESEDSSRLTSLFQRISNLVTTPADRAEQTKTRAAPVAAPVPAPAPGTSAPGADANPLQRMFGAMNMARAAADGGAPLHAAAPTHPDAGVPAAVAAAWEPTSDPAPAAAGPALLTPDQLLGGLPATGRDSFAGLGAAPIATAPTAQSVAPRAPAATADRAAVKALLRAMAVNDRLCDEFAKELRNSGMLQ